MSCGTHDTLDPYVRLYIRKAGTAWSRIRGTRGWVLGRVPVISGVFFFFLSVCIIMVFRGLEHSLQGKSGTAESGVQQGEREKAVAKTCFLTCGFAICCGDLTHARKKAMADPPQKKQSSRRGCQGWFGWEKPGTRMSVRFVASSSSSLINIFCESAWPGASRSLQWKGSGWEMERRAQNESCAMSRGLDVMMHDAGRCRLG